MTLVEHLAELRSRIIKVLIAVAVGGVIGFLLYNRVLHLLQEPYCDVSKRCTFIVTDPLEGFSIRLKVSAYIGFLIGSPVVLWQLWRFITPALHPHERRYAVPFVISGVLLFVMGAVIALITFPEALKFLVSIGGNSIEPFYTPGKYISLIIFMMLAFGAGFEFPVLLVFLQLAGILQWRQLAGWWRYAVIVIFFVDAVITPSQDPISLLALGIPMTVFYGASILIGRLIQRDRVRSR
ncbi:MAG: sec-independent protein translocase protein TatC [Actinomycetota bacterium]|jgi:sec-independent protein translocase protein TatC